MGSVLIKLIQEKHLIETMTARKDFAKVTNQPVIENPYWFLNTETGREYYGIYSGLGWPQKFNERGDGRPGYSVIVGIIKEDGIKPENANLEVLDECEEESVDNLIKNSIRLRKKWGYGTHPSLFEYFIGDHMAFESVVAYHNVQLIEKTGSDRNAFILTPPDDLDTQNSFDIYYRRLQSVMSKEGKRLFIRSNEIIKNRILSFMQDDPAIIALGGLVHTILLRTPWMDQSGSSVWQMQEV